MRTDCTTLTQSDLADRLDVSQPQISKMLRAGTIPPPDKPGRPMLWNLGTIVAWENEGRPARQPPTRPAEPSIPKNDADELARKYVTEAAERIGCGFDPRAISREVMRDLRALLDAQLHAWVSEYRSKIEALFDLYTREHQRNQPLPAGWLESLNRRFRVILDIAVNAHEQFLAESAPTGEQIPEGMSEEEYFERLERAKSKS